ncbi:MAG: hypothetical protein AAB503_01625 [Patescibacteria group bacterium]
MFTPEHFNPQRPIRKVENSHNNILEAKPRRNEGAGSPEKTDENIKKEVSPESLLEEKLTAKEQLTSKLNEVNKALENLDLTLEQAKVADGLGSPSNLNTESIKKTIEGFKIKQMRIIAGIQKISNQDDVLAWEKKQAEEKKKVEDGIRAASQKLMPQVREIIKDIVDLADRKFKLQRETSAQKREYNKALEDMRKVTNELEELKNARTGAEIIRFLNEAKENLGFLEFGKKSKIEGLIAKKAWFEVLDDKANYLKELILKQEILDLHIKDIGAKYRSLINEALAMETNELKILARKFNMSANFSAGVKSEIKRAIEPLINNGKNIIDPEKEMIREVWKKVEEGEQTTIR